MTQNNLREQADKVIARCRYLAQFSEEPGQIKRTFLSPAMRDCMQAVQGWMEAAGMQVRPMRPAICADDMLPPNLRAPA